MQGNPHMGILASGRVEDGCKRWLKGHWSTADAVEKQEEEGRGSGFTRREATAVVDPVGPHSILAG